MRDAAYRASVALAREKGAFPLFDAERLPRLRQGPAAAGGDPRRDPRARACATATCSSIAPTGTISLAFADNASNGIEPAYSWFYTRKKREPDGSMREYRVEDHAWRLWRARGGNGRAAAGLRQRARDLGARPHGDAGGDPALHRRGDLEDGERAGGLSVRGVRGPLPRGLAGRAEGDHHLPAEQRARRGAVGRDAPQDLDQSEPDRRIRIADAPQVALAALRWPHRPKLTAGLAVLDLHGRGAGQPLRGLRRARRERRPAAVRGLGQRRADAARPGGAGQEPLAWTCGRRTGPG